MYFRPKTSLDTPYRTITIGFLYQVLVLIILISTAYLKRPEDTKNYSAIIAKTMEGNRWMIAEIAQGNRHIGTRTHKAVYWAKGQT